MSQDEGMTSERLREYLASRDVACHACGQNLRGLPGPICPECGTVIPAPVEHAKRRCDACGYDVSGLDVECCPECGSSALGDGDTLLRSPEARRRLRMPRKLARSALWSELWIGMVAALLHLGFGLNNPAHAIAGALLGLAPCAGIVAMAVRPSAVVAWACAVLGGLAVVWSLVML